MPTYVTRILIGAALGFEKALGFILTAALGIIGAALAAVLFANPISMVVGAIVILLSGVASWPMALFASRGQAVKP